MSPNFLSTKLGEGLNQGRRPAQASVIHRMQEYTSQVMSPWLVCCHSTRVSSHPSVVPYPAGHVRYSEIDVTQKRRGKRTGGSRRDAYEKGQGRPGETRHSSRHQQLTTLTSELVLGSEGSLSPNQRASQ